MPFSPNFATIFMNFRFSYFDYNFLGFIDLGLPTMIMD